MTECRCLRPLDHGFCPECGELAESCRCAAASPARRSLPAPTITAADVEPERVEWLWPDRVAFGMTTVMGGFPGVGKSTILYDLAARTTREDRNVLVATAEDHLAAVVRPRLSAAKADLRRVELLRDELALPDDVGKLGELVRTLNISLVIVDPLVAFIGDGVNTHRDHHVRRVLAPLGALAEETRVALVVVIHTNKGDSSDPLMRISGSIGFTGAARSVLVAADDPRDDTRRILAVAKSNLAKIPAPVAYRLVEVGLDDGITTSRVEWLGEAPEVDVRELLAVRDRGARQSEKARSFLRESGVMVAPRRAAELQEEADAAGINYRTLRRAADELLIEKWQDGFHGGWWWGPKTVNGEDKHRGHRTDASLSPVRRPAETVATVPTEDRGHELSFLAQIHAWRPSPAEANAELVERIVEWAESDWPAWRMQAAAAREGFRRPDGELFVGDELWSVVVTPEPIPA